MAAWEQRSINTGDAALIDGRLSYAKRSLFSAPVNRQLFWAVRAR